MLGSHAVFEPPVHVPHFPDASCRFCGYHQCASHCPNRQAAPEPKAAPEQKAPPGWLPITDGRFDGFERDDKRACVCGPTSWNAGIPNGGDNGHYTWDREPWRNQPKHETAEAAMAWADAQLAIEDAKQKAEAPAAQLFKRGDRVRCIDASHCDLRHGKLKLGQVYVAEVVNDGGTMTVEGYAYWTHASRFELVHEPAAAGDPVYVGCVATPWSVSP